MLVVAGCYMLLAVVCLCLGLARLGLVWVCISCVL